MPNLKHVHSVINLNNFLLRSIDSHTVAPRERLLLLRDACTVVHKEVFDYIQNSREALAHFVRSSKIEKGNPCQRVN